MYTRIEAAGLEEMLLPMSKRSQGAGVYFARLCFCDSKILENLWAYHEAARKKGVILEGQISNPDERQMNYLNETLGNEFQPTENFILNALNKWMPRMSAKNRAEFSRALAQQFNELRNKGKTESILKNIYFKMMCWLYYKFERLMPYLGDDDCPKILYESNSITNHELILLRILSAMGADILLLETADDKAYLKQDAGSQFSQLLYRTGKPFAPGFTLKDFRKQMAAKAVPARPQLSVPVRQNVPMTTSAAVNRSSAQNSVRSTGAASQLQRPQPAKIIPENYFPKPSRSACTNAWMKESAFTEILTPVVSRGDDFRLFYNAFIRVKGVPDKLTYTNELYQFYQQFKNTGRNIVIVDDALTLPGPEDTGKIKRRNYRSPEEMIVDLAGNLPSCANVDLQRLMQQSFVQVMKKAAEKEPNVNRLVVTAVYLLCWIRQYQADLFQGYKGNEVPCFILMGGCRNQHDAVYMQFLSKLPVDVLILAPDLNRICTLEDASLLELSGKDSLPVMPFPRSTGSVQMRTMASHAEQDLTSLLYTGSGIYRNRQFAMAEAITLQTTYDEIFILWEQELKYRSNFSTSDQTVNMPVIYAKISGVENGKIEAYWQKIKLLLGNGTYLVDHLPMHIPGEANPFQSLAVKAIKNGKLKREEIKAHRQYPFGLIREELQEHIMDKLQLMLDRKLIKGTFVNGTEYTIISTVLNMKKELIRMLQSFDFTKKNPKVVCLSTNDQTASLEDTIMFTFLNLIGFDIVIFVPTGYQTVERYLNDNYPVEHQIGDYVYDLTVPNFDALPQVKSHSWLNILKRGN